MGDEEIIAKRKEKLAKFFKSRYDWIVYLILAFIIFLSIRIRTLNLDKLRDITTGGWTLGPDLDPFLFLRWAKYIVVHGSLYTLDTMRYIPLGYNTSGELLLGPYMIAWFHKVAVLFGSTSVDQSAALYPVFFFAITVVAFFLMTRKMFINSLGNGPANALSLIASLLLTITPVLLPRTIAGIPEKEASAFFFMFISFYFFIIAWNSSNTRKSIIFAFISGVLTAAMTLIWGGSSFLVVTIGISVFLSFALGQVERRRFYIYLSWVLLSFLLPYIVSSRYSLLNILLSTITGSVIGVVLIMGFHLFIFEPYLSKYFSRGKLSGIPKPILSTLIVILGVIILGTILAGPSFVFHKFKDLAGIFITPVTDRLGVTVAENKQPFFAEWSSSFGPILKGIPLFFWMFFIGSVYLCYFMLKDIFKQRERVIATISYTFCLIAVIFSRYSANSLFNGTNTISVLLFALGVILLIGVLGYYYYKYHKENLTERFSKAEFGIILLFSLFFLSLVLTRGAVRLVMVLVPSASIMASFLLVKSYIDARNSKKGETTSIILYILFVLFLISALYTGYSLYQQVSYESSNYAPTIYTFQWQKAMAWVRENTPVTAVFAHWWDYGYWVQSMGERATVLDGGNAISYWNYLMGRYALTGANEYESIDFLYSHNVTHFLIDSTDIGKYSAFSSIGSNENYDRRSFLSTLLKDNRYTKETKTGEIYIYPAGISLDEDILYELNGTRLFLPAGQAGLAAVLVEFDSSGKIKSQPQGIFVYQSKQYNLPLRYAFDSKFTDFGSGIESGIFVFPSISQNANGLSIDNSGALLYLSNRTVKSQLARLYLYKENDSYFKLVHSEDDYLIAQLKSQNPGFDGDMVYYDSVRGPIRIWEVSYPPGMKVNPEFLRTDYPDPALGRA